MFSDPTPLPTQADFLPSSHADIRQWLSLILPFDHGSFCIFSSRHLGLPSEHKPRGNLRSAWSKWCSVAHRHRWGTSYLCQRSWGAGVSSRQGDRKLFMDILGSWALGYLNGLRKIINRIEHINLQTPSAGLPWPLLNYSAYCSHLP